MRERHRFHRENADRQSLSRRVQRHPGQALGGHVIAEAVRRAGVSPFEVDDVVMGAALQQGSTGSNTARQCALRAGLPESVAGMTVDRQCASGLMAIATAAKQIMHDGMTIAVGGGLESISLVQTERMNRDRAQDPQLVEWVPELYMSMLETAEQVSDRYGISREAQDEYALQSQQRTAQAQAEGRFNAEIAPITTTMQMIDRQTGAATPRQVTLSADEGNRPRPRSPILPSCNRCSRTACASVSGASLPRGMPRNFPTAPRPVC